MYSDGIILLHGNFKHADTHHEKLSSRPAKAAPRAWFEATRNPVLSNPGFEPASTSSNGVKLPKKMAAQQETAESGGESSMMETGSPSSKSLCHSEF